MQYLTLNLDGSTLRREQLDGEDHYVVPMVMMTEGVHAGSEGPALYTAEDLKKTVQLWNHKPLVVYHPEKNGRGTTASDPVVINTRQVGLVLNTNWDQRLRAEAWLNIRKCKQIDNRIITKLENKEMVEVSTGVFVERINTPGVWNNEKYDFIAVNHKPDHLAILPDKIGACSIADGAGLLRNESTQPERNQLIVDRSAKQVLNLSGLSNTDLKNNNLSYKDLTYKLVDNLASRFGKKGEYWNGWIVDVYNDHVVYYDDNFTLNLIGFTASDTGVSLCGDPVEVVRSTSYRTKDQKKSFVRNESTVPVSLTQEDITMSAVFNKDEHLGKLIGNGYEETDREWLSKLPDEQLGKIKPIPKAAPVGNTTPTVPAPAPAPANLPAETIESYVSKAPAPIAQLLNDALMTQNAEKVALVERISGAQGNLFTKEWLNDQPVGTLRGMANLIPAPAAPTGNQQFIQLPPTLNYAGAGSLPPITNSKVTEEPLSLPVFNWKEDKK